VKPVKPTMLVSVAPVVLVTALNCVVQNFVCVHAWSSPTS